MKLSSEVPDVIKHLYVHSQGKKKRALHVPKALTDLENGRLVPVIIPAVPYTITEAYSFSPHSAPTV